MKNPQRLGNGFVEAAGSNFDCVFNAAKVNARNPACLQSHTWRVSYSLFIRYLNARSQSRVFCRFPLIRRNSVVRFQQPSVLSQKSVYKSGQPIRGFGRRFWSR